MNASEILTKFETMVGDSLDRISNCSWRTTPCTKSRRT